MFTYVKLKNFLSFGDVVFDFQKSKNSPKNVIAIYGENGSGKSNFVKSMELLCRTISSFDFIKDAEKIRSLFDSNDINKLKHNPPIELFNKIMFHADLKNFLASCRMIGCEENTEVEYGFILNGHKGIYRISFADNIMEESLYYFTGKQSGYLFNIKADANNKINSKLWTGLLKTTYRAEIDTEIEKYWGKHTFMGIMMAQIKEKNEDYINTNVSGYLIDAINGILELEIAIKNSNNSSSGFSRKTNNIILDRLDSGTIREKDLEILKRSEAILNKFFAQTYSDIKNVRYDYKKQNKNIQYQLYVDKMIAGKIRHINFKQESAGTQQILEIFNNLFNLFYGGIVVFDELDDGIHDLLISNIISSLEDEINGQLIFTTHNTTLLEFLDRKNIYLIQTDYMGNKNIACVDEFSVQATNNVRDKYLKGAFGGIPYVSNIDYNEILQEVDDKKGDL